MGYHGNLAIDTRTCGQADEDARLDKRDGLTTRITTNRARWAAAHKRLDAMESEMNDRQEKLAEVHYAEWSQWANERRRQVEALLTAHADAWWSDMEAPDYAEVVNATYEAYMAGGGSEEHYTANWRAYSDAAAVRAGVAQ